MKRQIKCPYLNTRKEQTYAIYFTNGLKDVVMDELQTLDLSLAIREHDDRFLLLTCSAVDAKRIYKSIHTADDMRILVGGPAQITNQQEFSALCSQTTKRTQELVTYDTDVAKKPWSVTLSAKKPIWRLSPKWDPAPIVAQILNGAEIDGKIRSPIDFRIQVNDDIMHISLKTWNCQIGNRDKMSFVRLGSLRPSVAAALVRLAISNIDPDIKHFGIYDPFAGTGTIVAEAIYMRLPIFASDIDEAAVKLTRDRLSQLIKPGEYNTKNISSELLYRIFVHDVCKNFPNRVNARIIVGNMPWGKQSKVKHRSRLFDATAVLVGHCIAQSGSFALLTTNEDQLVASIQRHVKFIKTSIRHISFLGQTPAIVTGRKTI